MKLFKYYNINKLKFVWNDLVRSNKNISIFQYFHYNKCLFNWRYIHTIGSKKIPLFLVVKDGNKVLMIAPLMKSLNKRNYSLFGKIQGSDTTDFIYRDELSDSEISQCLKLIISYCGKIDIERFNINSKVYKVYKEEHPGMEESFYPHVNIHFGNIYDEYYHNLSKNVRQNLRTSYNRIEKDNIRLELVVKQQMPLNREEWKRIIEVYYMRQNEIYKHYSAFKKFVHLRYKHDSVSLRTSTNNFFAILYYNNDIAAELMGFVNDENNRVVIPRLAINTKYHFYSPGNQLINELIKYFITNSSIRNLDLSRGNEKYKYSMGGEEYHTSSFTMM